MNSKLLVFMSFAITFLSACSSGTGVAGIGGSSKTVRVSVLAGNPLPQVADSVRSVYTGKLKVYIMNEENTYRKDIVQEVNMNYAVPSKAEGERLRIASLNKKMVRVPIGHSAKKTSSHKTRKIMPAKVNKYSAGASSKVVTKSSHVYKPPVKVTEVPLSNWQKPKQQEKKSLSDYQEAIKRLNKQKSIDAKAKKDPVKKRAKKRIYNYHKNSVETQKTNKRVKRTKSNRLKRKGKWKWDENGKIIRS